LNVNANYALDQNIFEFSFNTTATNDPTTYKDIYVAPTKYDDAWNHPDPFQRKMWREAIGKELNKMKEMRVWKKVKRSSMPKNKRCVKCKWVFDIKRNGVFRARLVACGYSQVPGEDFNEVYSPVGNEPIIRLLIVLCIVWGLDYCLLDVVTAFLHGNLDEEIFMNCPDGLIHLDDEILLLLKSLYGLVQSARQFYLMYVKILKQIGFVQSNADPCLLIKKSNLGIVMMIIHVDDCFTIGNRKAIDHVIEEIKKKGLELKVEYNFTDYLGCEIYMKEDKAWMGQQGMIKKIEQNFGEMVKGVMPCKTPGTPNYNITQPKPSDELISDQDQAIYRSGVGSLLYLVKYSRPDIANAVRELAKCMGKASPAAYKELKRVLKYVLSTKNYGLYIEPKVSKVNKWEMIVYTDSDWAGDKDNRHSVTGYVMYFMNVPIMWKSRLQKTVALSSTEAEYYALSEAAKEIKFLIQVLESMGVKLELPVIVNVDNVGAIFMAENSTATSRTRHVDTRYHFIRELIEDGIIKIIFVRSGKNRADGFTKNVSNEVYNEHLDTFIAEKEYLEID
jgi:Reverse transcriptase (RNA-dependent DNA polymerase)